MIRKLRKYEKYNESHYFEILTSDNLGDFTFKIQQIFEG